MKVRLPALLLAASISAGCEREQRTFREPPPAAEKTPTITLSTLVLGSHPLPKERQKYERIAYDVSEGKQLFSWFNCNGCHANGGGDAGPPLMDEKWLYGSSIENIYASIRDGRPNGMPAFGDKATTDEIWKLAAYVRSMSGLVASDVAPARNDDLWPRPAENRISKASPVNGGTVPPSAQMP
jgi:cytochrome c oxidase cbb3-type subunit 3